MLDISSYDSGDEVQPPEPAAGGGPGDGAATASTGTEKIVALEEAAKIAVAGEAAGKPKKLPALRLRELRREIQGTKSATAVVQVVRRYLDSAWDLHWGAEALYQIALRSTARTRRAWANDPAVLKLAEKLRAQASSSTPLPTRGEPDDVDLILVALEGLRRMSLQQPEDQKDALEQVIIALVADNWRHPVKSVARLYWLGAPLHLKSKPADFSSLLPTQLRSRAQELDGPDIALLIASFRKHKDARDAALLEKVVTRLRAEGIHQGLSATDLVEIAEGLNELGAHDEGAIRPLGQETLRRRGELSPDESHRVHTAFQAMKLPLPQVWAKPGASKKRTGEEIVTSQAFVPQEGHEKKRRGNHDIERTSPPRVVRDYKMMSY
mmetsp:Transcript_73458/g.215452  ORF Transcript_73458/g.215452 Transcript_73458/m.215452 type:complete len:381 (-) Transcript_73458:60-1202(-)